MRPLHAAVAAVLVAAAAVSVAVTWRGVDTDLFSLIDDGRHPPSLLSELNRRSRARIRVLCARAAAAAKCRAAFTFDPPVDPAAALDLVRTHGKGLLSPKARDLLRADETNRIARSTFRRDYSGVGLFPKADDPHYFLNDFVIDLRRYLPPELTEGRELLTGTVADPAALAPLVALAAADAGIHLSGAPFHTRAATASTQREINILGGLSFAAVLALGWLLFRSFRFILPTVVALGAGFLVGTAAVGLLPGRPHALTFLFGTTLIGLGVDYCFHALHGCRVRDLARALVTTVCAFAPLLFSSVSVLRQMAVFTSAGLTAIFALALLFRGDRPPSSVGTDPARGGARLRENGEGPQGRLRFWLQKCAFWLVFVVAAAGLMRLTFGNDPASFYRPDPFLAAQEAAVAAALGTTEARFELVDLDAWQRENAALKAKMGPVPGEFLTAADLPPDVTVSLDGRDYLLLPSENGLTLRDELARTFAALAAETNRLLAVSFVVLVAALAALFRGRFAAHVLPIGAAILATAGALGWWGAPVSFFQLLSFFILAGLGIDYVIFHRADAGDATARRVVRFSFLTSLVGFGLLAFTSFPVTRAMGVTLALGLSFAYLFSLPCACVRRAGPRAGA